MPSAANVKIDKQISSENALADSSANSLAPLTPLRQAITAIEHKIRNLEKRKSKLESYRELQNSGKELNNDQKTALAKINEVIQTLDFARDLHKQFLGIANSTEKEAKKLAKKEALAKSQAELARLREILLVQDALNQMGNDTVREDFLHGRNGATQLSETDIKLLDDLYPAVTPKHEAGNATAFTNEVQAAAEHLLAVVDGKNKEVFGGTYSQIKEVLGKIHESGYFDQAQVFEETEILEQVEDVERVPENNLQEVPPPPQDQAPQSLPPLETLTIESRQQLLPPQQPQPAQMAPVPVPVEEPVQPQLLQQQPPPPQMEAAPLVTEQIFYQQAAVPQQIPQPQLMRPLTEMLGAGNFFFLQESEIDTPETIPTQTFTNQSFVAQPPPPIPLPHQYQ